MVVFKLNEFPEHNGPVLDAEAAGRGLTVTLTLDVLVQPLAVTVTVYVPLMAVVAFVRTGFCTAEV